MGLHGHLISRGEKLNVVVQLTSGSPLQQTELRSATIVAGWTLTVHVSTVSPAVEWSHRDTRGRIQVTPVGYKSNLAEC